MGFSVGSFIQGNEGLSLKLIPDAGGTWQIGYGRNLSRRGISEAEAAYLFNNDLAQAISDAAAVVGDAWIGLDSIRQAALTDMAYELGHAGLAEFHDMIAAIQDGNWQDARDACLASNYAKEVPTRSLKVATMLLVGEPP